jgi:ABC-type uncharacterized transport system involved in gliding motility auxiliary subunit
MLDTIERENFEVKSLNLLVSDIPADASIIVINNPVRDLSPDGAVKLLDFLAQGGRLMVMADFNIRELTNLNTVLASYGVQFDYGIVREIDPNYVAIDPRSVWPDLPNHDITAPLWDRTRTPVVLLEAMPLSTLETRRRSIEITPLMTSSPRSFLRIDLSNPSFTQAPSDIPGPLTLGMAVMDPSWIDPREPVPQARLVLIGSGRLLPIANSGFDANRDLFMNSMVWLQDRPESITVRSKSLFMLPMRLTLMQIIIFGGIFTFIIPMAFFVTGFVTWLRRRHL